AMLVADGMGGEAAGEVASRLALSTLVKLVLATPDWILSLADDLLVREVARRATQRREQINAALAELAQADPAVQGLGTTLTVAVSLGQDLFIVHLGDSRAYRWRRGILARLTHDHTLAQEAADRGIIRQEEVATHRWRHALTQALGDHGRAIQPQLRPLLL